MRLSAKLLGFAVALSVGGLAAGTALSQDKDKIVTERQDLMKQQGREWVVIRNFLQEKADQAAALSAAEALSKSVATVPNYFPPGTGIDEVPVKTRAKPEIWHEHDKFLAANKTVSGQITALETAVKSGDKAKVEVAFKDLDGCNGCHNTFRAKAQ
jgi:cytochrome c556